MRLLRPLFSSWKLNILLLQEEQPVPSLLDSIPLEQEQTTTTEPPIDTTLPPLPPPADEVQPIVTAATTTTALPDVGDIVIQKLQESTAGTPEANRVDALLGEGGALFNAIQSIIKTETEKYKLKVFGLILAQ